MNNAVNIEGSGVGHKLETCDCIVDSLGGCVDCLLLVVLQTLGNYCFKGFRESVSGLGGVLLVVVLFLLLSFSLCLSRIVSGVVGVVLNPCRNDCYVVCGHGLGKCRIPTLKGLMLLCGFCNTDSCAIVNHGLCAVNRKLVLVTAVVDLKNKAAVRKDCAGKDTVVSNREALAGVGGYGNGLAGSSGLVLGSSVAVVTVKTHDIGLNLVADGACGELGVKSNILDTHDSDFGVPTCEGVAFLGGSFGGDDLSVNLCGDGTIKLIIDIELCVVGHEFKTLNRGVYLRCLSVNNMLLAELLAGDILIKCGVKGSSGVGSVLLVVVGLCLLSVGSCNSYVIIGVVCGILVPLSRKSDALCGHGGGNFLHPAVKFKSGLFGSGGINYCTIIAFIGLEVRISISYGVLIA